MGKKEAIKREIYIVDSMVENEEMKNDFAESGVSKFLA